MLAKMNMRGKRRKVVQTELDQDDYETLLALARRKKMTIKEAAREALCWWSNSVLDLAGDPLFKLKPIEFKAKIRSNGLEDFLYRK